MGAFAISAVGAQNKVEKSGIEAVYDGLEWRFIGPYRGGRAVAVAGVEDDCGAPNRPAAERPDVRLTLKRI